MKDGLVLFYVKDDTLYPVAMSEDDRKMLEFLSMPLQPIKVVFQKPQGTAVNLGGKEI